MQFKRKLKSYIKNNNFFYKLLKFPYHIYRFLKLSYLSGSNKDIFTNIYLKNKWGDSCSYSGSGSNLEQTTNILKELPDIFKKYEIKSIVDLPCGDFYWMQKLNLSEIDYLGGDIVPEIIEKNKLRFNEEKKNFRVIDIITDSLPQADMIFCRDCLVHFSYQDIYKSLKNIKNSKFKYLLTTSFLNRKINRNIATGSWRTLNLMEEPFNFPKPIEIILENCTEYDSAFSDKALCLWELASIPI